jgi:hypothetical protein
MPYFELSPAYGRDYKTATQVKADFGANKDFNGDFQLGFTLVNREQIPKGSTVILRYARNTRLTTVKV